MSKKRRYDTTTTLRVRGGRKEVSKAIESMENEGWELAGQRRAGFFTRLMWGDRTDLTFVRQSMPDTPNERRGCSNVIRYSFAALFLCMLISLAAPLLSRNTVRTPTPIPPTPPPVAAIIAATRPASSQPTAVHAIRHIVGTLDRTKMLYCARSIVAL